MHHLTRRTLAVAAGTALASKCALHSGIDRDQTHEGGSRDRRSGWGRSRFSPQPALAQQVEGGGGERSYPYVILGSGTAAHAALETIRLNNPKAEVLMISASEAALPRMDKSSGDIDSSSRASHLETRLREVYDEWRRPLSNSLWEFSEQVSLIRASRVKIDVEDHTISLADRKVHYDKCLLASAGRPREFYVLDRDKISHSGANESINTLYTSIDFNNLANFVQSSTGESDKKRHITVVGGGYLGTEIVTALAETGICKVTHLMGERTPLAQYLPAYLSEHVAKSLASMGVDIRGEALLTGLRPTVRNDDSASQNALPFSANNISLRRTRSRSQHGLEDGLTLNLVGANQVNLETEYLVLASTNVQPDLMGLDDPSVGLEVAEGGVVANASLEAYDGLFIAGNAATYFDPAIGRRRVDTYDHAVASGMWAAHNMMSTDRLEQYTHQPSLKSNLHGIGLCFIGIGKIDAKLETVGVWFKPGYEGLSSSDQSKALDDVAAATGQQQFKRGLVYYLERGRVVGVLLCNSSEMLERARDVLRAKRVVTDPVNELPKTILLAPHHWLSIISTK